MRGEQQRAHGSKPTFAHAKLCHYHYLILQTTFIQIHRKGRHSVYSVHLRATVQASRQEQAVVNREEMKYNRTHILLNSQLVAPSKPEIEGMTLVHST